MHPDFPALLEHLQAIEAATGMAVGQQASEILRYVDRRHPLRKDLIDVAVGFSSTMWCPAETEVGPAMAEISMGGIKIIPPEVTHRQEP